MCRIQVFVHYATIEIKTKFNHHVAFSLFESSTHTYILYLLDKEIKILILLLLVYGTRQIKKNINFISCCFLGPFFIIIIIIIFSLASVPIPAPRILLSESKIEGPFLVSLRKQKFECILLRMNSLYHFDRKRKKKKPSDLIIISYFYPIIIIIISISYH